MIVVDRPLFTRPLIPSLFFYYIFFLRRKRPKSRVAVIEWTREWMEYNNKRTNNRHTHAQSRKKVDKVVDFYLTFWHTGEILVDGGGSVMPKKEAAYGATLLDAQLTARSRYKKRLFLAHVKRWIETGRIPREMPTLKTYHEDLEITLKKYGLTDAMHIARTGRPWPRSPKQLAHERYERDIRESVDRTLVSEGIGSIVVKPAAPKLELNLTLDKGK